jgi:formylglycine-generating enzyme required for sulfatase activity
VAIKLEFARGDVLAGKYEVLDHLDDSPLGATYRVKHLKSGKFVRLTALRIDTTQPDAKAALDVAFQKAKDLKNPHLVRLGEIGDHEGAAFFTWEDFEARSLRELIQEYRLANRKFGLKDAAQVVNQVLEALSALHDEGVILRALRPEYVLVNVRYAGPRQQNFVAHVKIVGAGLWDLVLTSSLIEDEYTRGDAQYLAPELKGFDPVATPRADIYAAGVLFYEMLTGQAPVGTFLAPSQVRPDLPKLADDVVELAMANSPDDRYRTARDLANGVQRVFETAANEGEPAEAGRPWLLVGGLVAVGVLVVVAVAVSVYALVSVDTDNLAQVRDQELRLKVKELHKMPTKAERDGVQARHPKGMIYVPPGPFVMGRLEHDPFANRNAEPVHELVELPGYLIDAFEYPNLLNGAPTTKVTWTQAEQMCQAQGKRLCSDQEWEKACKGPLNHIYAYGDTFDPTFCGEGIMTEYQSGQNPECRSGWGVYDLSGGMKEWTATPAKSEKGRRVVKGGLLSSAEKGARCAYATDDNEGYSHGTLSFRCCRDVEAPPFEGVPATPAGAPDGAVPPGENPPGAPAPAGG